VPPLLRKEHMKSVLFALVFALTLVAATGHAQTCTNTNNADVQAKTVVSPRSPDGSILITVEAKDADKPYAASYLLYLNGIQQQIVVNGVPQWTIRLGTLPLQYRLSLGKGTATIFVYDLTGCGTELWPLETARVSN